MDTNEYQTHMDIKRALEILEITETSTLTMQYIKKQYHKLALKCHPDKNNNTIAATHKFQQIKESYDYLLVELTSLNVDDNSSFVSSNESQDTDTDYVKL